jgi:hypothetical protein
VLRLDLTGGNNAAVFSCTKEGQQEVEIPAMQINGVEFEGGPTEFSATVDLTQGAAVTLSNVEDLASYWIDPDYCGADGKFIPVSGKYKVTLDTSAKTLRASLLNADGSRPNIEQGGLYALGWGVASYSMGGQCGWELKNSYQIAQVSKGVFQMTGTAVAETDKRAGGRFRTDYTDLKWFFAYDSWDGQGADMTLTEEGAHWLKATSGGNVNINTPLEEGATYRLTVDFTGCTLSGSSVTGKPVVDFKKL